MLIVAFLLNTLRVLKGGRRIAATQTVSDAPCIPGMRLDKTNAALRRGIEKLELRNAARKEQRRQKARHSSSAPKSAKGDKPDSHPLFNGQHSKKKRRRVPILEQWVEVETGPVGETITTLYPPNDILIENGQKMWPSPELVYRRFHFVKGVPREYLWATNESAIRLSGGLGVQRMTIDTWLKLVAREEAEGKGHLLPTGNLPRPEERGGCECRVCSDNRRLLK